MEIIFKYFWAVRFYESCYSLYKLIFLLFKIVAVIYVAFTQFKQTQNVCTLLFSTIYTIFIKKQNYLLAQWTMVTGN